MAPPADVPAADDESADDPPADGDSCEFDGPDENLDEVDMDLESDDDDVMRPSKENVEPAEVVTKVCISFWEC